MQENQQHSPIMKPRKYFWYLSIFLIGSILTASITLMVVTYSHRFTIEALRGDIESVQSEIDTLSNDRKILIANIIKNNTLRPSLDLGKLITGFNNAAQLSNVRLKWFAVTEDTISTQLIATQGDSWVHPDPAATVIKMIKEYASGKMEYSLEPIVSLSGDPSERTTNITLHVLPSKTE